MTGSFIQYAHGFGRFSGFFPFFMVPLLSWCLVHFLTSVGVDLDDRFVGFSSIFSDFCILNVFF